MSATPCTSSPANLAEFMRLTETNQWRQDPNTREYDHKLLQQLGKQFEIAIYKTELEQIATVLDRLRTFFRAINFLKRTKESVWFSQLCLNLPEQVVHHIGCPLKNIRQLRQTRLKRYVSSKDIHRTGRPDNILMTSGWKSTADVPLLEGPVSY
ncbi:hypothetical protein BDV59DRAFT_200076 [Aspergillus ambiguus]|uniref:uncharacterized protein n=1 Tax=Aspergillus ambiguus TaxID=176160 RepID=UPI003CCE1480